MERALWGGEEIVVDVTGFFTTHHDLRAEMGSLGTLTLPAFSRGGVFRAAGGWELLVERTSWWRSWHELREDGVVVGTARPLNFWRQTMSIGFRGQMAELVPANFWARSWQLVGESGRVRVIVEPRGVFRRGAYVRPEEPLPLDLLVFVYYLVHVRWQEQAAAASSAAAAGS